MAIPAQARVITARVQTVIRAIDGTGPYNFDLSRSTDDVEYGDVATASLPCVLINAVEVDSGDSVLLTKYNHTMTIGLTCYVGADSDSPGDRLLNALDLASDVHRAIAADRVLVGVGTLNELTTRVAVGPGIAFDGASTQLGDMGVVSTSVTIEYRTAGGI
jgi:hypothetical protein